MSEIKSNLAALSTQMAAIMEKVKQNHIEHHHGVHPPEGGQTGMLPLWGHGTLQEGVPKFVIAEREETSVFSGQ
jgi:hypothetical protein